MEKKTISTDVDVACEEKARELNSDTKNKKKYFHIATDLIWSIAGLVVMNGCMQLFINPTLQKWMGEVSFGNYQSVMAVVAIVGTTFGVAANYSRMVRSSDHKDRNGDYNIFLIISAVLCLAFSAVALIVYNAFNVKDYLLLFLLMVFTLLRYYGDVYFRLKLNYRGFFLYYCFITAGYCVGLAVFKFITNDWILTILLGELMAVVFVAIRGDLFKGKDVLKRSKHFKGTQKSVWTLTATNFLSALTQNTDRIILNLTSGGAAVSCFYVSTLLGKVVALLSTPLNSVIMGYLAKYNGKITKKFFAVLSSILLGLGLVAVVACYVASLIFVKLFYKDLYMTAKPYFLLANAGQVFFFLSNLLMTVLLKVGSEKHQFVVNIIYMAVYAALVIPMTMKMSTWGLVYALLIVNCLKFVGVSLFGIAISE